MDVVQIRQSEPIMKMDKMNGRRWDHYTFVWFHPYFIYTLFFVQCVEDPFDLTHNLTGGVKIDGEFFTDKAQYLGIFLVLFNFYKTMEKTLAQIALLDRKLQEREQFACREMTMLNLLQNSESKNGMSVLSKLFDF